MDIIDEQGNIVPDRMRESKRNVTAAMAIIFGCFGIHKFILGYRKEGIIMLAITFVTCGIGGGLTGLIGLIEGIIYLTKSDEEFIYEYQINKKSWF